MPETAQAIGFALFSWWFGTGLVFLVERWSRAASPMRVRAGIAAAAVAALYAVHRAGALPAPLGSYLGFSAGIGLWAALELAFLSGWLIGPMPSGPVTHGLRHFARATRALLYHELSLLAALAAAWIATPGGGDPTAIWTLLSLWAMRESAKLNLHLGVRNTAVELLPPRLDHLRGYFGSAPINPLWPISIGVSVIVEAWLLRTAVGAEAGSAIRIPEILVATLLALGTLEHVMLVLPIRPDLLWRWATRRRPPPSSPAGIRIGGC